MFKVPLYFATALMAVAGLPQLHPPGILTVIEKGKEQDSSVSSKPTVPLSGQQLQVIPQKNGPGELTGHILLQIFFGRGALKEDFKKIHEINSTFSIPLAAPTDNARISTCDADDHAKYEPDGQCYEIGNFAINKATPCPTSFKTYQERHDKPGYGDCFCVPFVATTRPVVYWEANDGCYWLFEQGPCNAGEWLVFSNVTDVEGNRRPTCRKRTCPENTAEDEGSSYPHFWFEHKGKCYKTGTQNPELCSNPKEKIYFSNEKPEPTCSSKKIFPVPVRAFASGVGFLGCKPGFKPQANHECKRIASFE